jgi:hypothetical protein
MEEFAIWRDARGLSHPDELWNALSEGACPIKGQVGQAIALLGRHMSTLLKFSGDIGAAIDHIMGTMGYEELLRRKDPDDERWTSGSQP